MRKPVLVLISLLVALSMLVTACSAPAPTAAPPAPAQGGEATKAPEPTKAEAAQPVTLRMMLVDRNDDVDKWLNEEVFPEFQKDHPNVTVEIIPVTWTNIDETIAGYFATGEGADILNLGSEYAPMWGDQLAPLNQYLGEAAWPEIKQFSPGTLATATWKGELRGLPWLSIPRVYIGRKDLGGTPPATFEEAIQEGKDATVIEDGKVVQAGFWIEEGGRILQDWQEYVSFIWALGAPLYNDDGTPNFNTPEGKAAMKFMYDRRRAILPDETTAGLPEAQGSRLADGSSALVWGAVWSAPPVDDPIWEQLEIGPSPTDPSFPNGQRVSVVFNDWLAVPAYSKNVELAAELLKLLGTAENLNRYDEIMGCWPPRKDAWFGYMENPVMQEIAKMGDEYGIGWADVRLAPQLKDILQRELATCMSSKGTDADIETAVTNIQNDYEAALKDAGLLQ